LTATISALQGSANPTTALPTASKAFWKPEVGMWVSYKMGFASWKSSSVSPPTNSVKIDELSLQKFKRRI
jgi:hypothetical protein